MAGNLPYVTSIGTLKKMLQQIQTATQPERFTHDFVETKLGMKGGTARSIIPFIKKMGLVSPDGFPTELYREFRNRTRAGIAIAKCMKNLYSELFEMNEYAYELEDKQLLGLIVQITGGHSDSAVTKYTLATFKVLKELANFDNVSEAKVPEVIVDDFRPSPRGQMIEMFHQQNSTNSDGINLSYTINLNLPATTNIEVFNAIFKSIREHLLNQ